jgi:iron uptake system component EfeO
VPAGVRPVVCGLLTTGVLVAGLSGCGPGAPAGNVITVSTSACGSGWRQVHAGTQTFQISNSSTGTAEAELIDPANGAIYAEADRVGPGTTVPMRADLGSGRYAFRCLIGTTAPRTGPVARIGGHRRGATAVLPVTAGDLLGPARLYHSYVTAALNTLASQAGTLAALIRAGHLGAARRAWLPAHLTYERLGGAYGTFGNYGTEIDGGPDGLPRGVSDPAFTGFYRIEYGLWHGQSAAGLAGTAAALDRDVRELRTLWPGMTEEPADLGPRTQEILEDALQFQLTGHDDFGSGTTLATTSANITGTFELLSILHPLLAPRYRGLPAVYTWLNRLRRLLLAQQQPDGTWTPVSKLTVTAREQIDAAASQALEELAPIVVITEPQRS